jgi:hypothetical protein
MELVVAGGFWLEIELSISSSYVAELDENFRESYVEFFSHSA